MRSRKSLAAAFVAVATTGLVAAAVIGAQAQPAGPPQHDFTSSGPDGKMDPFKLLKQMDGAPTPPSTGDDKVACDRATRAQARFEGGISTAQEHSRALEHAKSLAATVAMRRAIDSGLLPACPPDDPTEAQP